MHQRQRALRGLCRTLVLLAGLCLLPSPVIHAGEIGQVRKVYTETQIIRIDDRRFRLDSNLVPRYAGDEERIADPGAVRSGMPVEYETRPGEGGLPVITRLRLLARD